MEIKKIYGMYFSATGTTEKIVSRVASKLAELITPGVEAEEISFNLPSEREITHTFGRGDLVVIGTPTYAGRVPNVLLPYLKGSISFEHSLCVPIILYGNRNYDDSLIELFGIVKDNGGVPVAAAAFVGEHSFSYKLAAGRPDEHDLKIADDLAVRIEQKLNGLMPRISESSDGRDITELKELKGLKVKGEEPIRPYYTPRDRNGNAIDIRKVKPVTGPECTKCGLCSDICPMGSISKDDPSEITGICIKCGACVKKCPEKCKYFTDENYLYHMHELEDMYSSPKEPELFI